MIFFFSKFHNFIGIDVYKSNIGVERFFEEFKVIVTIEMEHINLSR